MKRQNAIEASGTAKRACSVALLAFCFALSTRASLAEGPVILSGNPTIPPARPVCGTGQDLDGDGVCNSWDNCLRTFNPSQTDADVDGHGDACDNCPGAPNGFQRDTDGDGQGDACDRDIQPGPTPSGGDLGSHDGGAIALARS